MSTIRPTSMQLTHQDHSNTAAEAARGAYAGGRGRMRVYYFDPPQGDTRLKVVDMTRGRVSRKTNRPVGEPVLRIDRPHRGADFPHINTKISGLDHTKIPHVPNGVLKVARHAGKGLLVVGVAADVIDLKRSHAADEARGDGRRTETKRAVGRVAGGWTGAAAGAATGAVIGSAVPIVGTAVGAIAGGIAGSIGGSTIGEWLAD